MGLAIGIDVGGTTSRAGLVGADNRLLESVRFPTPAGLNAFIESISETIAPWFSKYPSPMEIGLALPGVVDRAKGVVVRSVNVPWLKGEPLGDLIAGKCGRKPALMTDAEAATWGEYLAAGSPASPLAHLRLGTGVACGIVVDRELIPTSPLRQTHWTLLVVDESEKAPLCPCGLRGCLELFAGGASLTRTARGGGFADLTQLHQAAMANEERAVQIIDQAALAICRAIAKLAEAYGVAIVIVDGGVLAAIPHLIEQIQEAVTKSAYSRVQVRAAKLGDDAGMIGAARLASIGRPDKGKPNN